MLDVLEVYERPYDPIFPQICIDEKNHQLLQEIRKAHSNRYGVYTRDSEYKRNGVVKEFVCIEPKTGKIHIRVVDYRTGREFAKFVEFIVMHVYKQAQKVILVTDQLNIHSGKSIRDTYTPKYAKQIIDKIEWHYTPKHGSWLDQAEIAINGMSRAILKKRMGTKAEVQKQVRAYQRRKNNNPKPINWQFSKEKAIDKFIFTT